MYINLSCSSRCSQHYYNINTSDSTISTHNTLTGNIRVFCRVRPLLPTDPSYLRDSIGRESSVSGGSTGSSKTAASSQRTMSITYPDRNGDRKKLSLELAQEKVTDF